jgi:DNA-binding transcriptional LysR family regulator
MENWDEIRTAYQVARQGTVSGAAERLGVHHATVIRHIDALEARLGVKLFQRHARGYTATEAGEDLLRVAQTTDDQFQQLEGRIKGRGSDVSGELVITTLVALTPVLMAPLESFRRKYPDVIVRLLTGDRLFRLEYGEAHVALRAGPAPQEPDNVVQPFVTHPLALYGSKDYVAAHGGVETPEDLTRHTYVGFDEAESRAPFERWLRATVREDQIVFRCTDPRIGRDAVLQGIGLGFVSVRDAVDFPDLVQVMPPRPDWEAPTWLVTHVDLHRTAKVQAFLSHLKAHTDQDGIK